MGSHVKKDMQNQNNTNYSSCSLDESASFDDCSRSSPFEWGVSDFSSSSLLSAERRSSFYSNCDSEKDSSDDSLRNDIINVISERNTLFRGVTRLHVLCSEPR